MKLKKYEEVQQESYDAYNEMMKDIHNKKSGVACPKCGAELEYDSTITLACIPPKHDAWCTGCDFKGYV